LEHAHTLFTNRFFIEFEPTSGTNGHHPTGNEKWWRLERLWHSHGQKLSTPHNFDDIVHDQHNRIANQKLHQYVSLVDAPHEKSLKKETKQTDANASR
jgi:hypothetical protein